MFNPRLNALLIECTFHFDAYQLLHVDKFSILVPFCLCPARSTLRLEMIGGYDNG